MENAIYLKTEILADRKITNSENASKKLEKAF